MIEGGINARMSYAKITLKLDIAGTVYDLYTLEDNNNDCRLSFLWTDRHFNGCFDAGLGALLNKISNQNGTPRSVNFDSSSTDNFSTVIGDRPPVDHNPIVTTFTVSQLVQAEG